MVVSELCFLKHCFILILDFVRFVCLVLNYGSLASDSVRLNMIWVEKGKYMCNMTINDLKDTV